jgi:hypothetical protein
VSRIFRPQRGHGPPAFYAFAGCFTVRLRGQRTGNLRAFGFQAALEVTTSTSSPHFAHAMVTGADVASSASASQR